MTRLDRYGDPVEEDEDQVSGSGQVRGTSHHDPDCRDGWLGEDADGRPVPCLECRPHLRGRP